MMLAATGMRATEALSIRIKDLDLESQPARLFVRGEYTKTRVDRTVFLTEEIAQELEEHMSQEQRYLEYEVVSKAITKDIEQAYNHTRNHIRVQGEILKLDADCEYCKVYFEEQRILNR